MNHDEAREAIGAALARIAPEVDLAECDLSAPMGRELELDSMDVLTLLSALATQTGVEIPDADVDAAWSIDDLADYLASR